MTFYCCAICDWTQARKSEVLEHIKHHHKPETLVYESDTIKSVKE